MKTFIDGGHHYGGGCNQLKEEGIIDDSFLKIGFEPNPKIKTPSWVKQSALGDSDKDIDFFIQSPIDSDVSEMGSTALLEMKESLENMQDSGQYISGEFKTQIKVSQVRLSKLIFNLRLDGSKEIIVKLDVEGYEFKIVEDLINTGAIIFINHLIIEWHDWVGIYSSEYVNELERQITEKGVKITKWN